MVAHGTTYGVALNDRVERSVLSLQFTENPYLVPPLAPVVYIKPRSTHRLHGATVPVPSGVAVLEVAPTLALLFGRDSASDGIAGVAACCLALDVAVPGANYYRPAVPQRCADGFLPLGGLAAPILPTEIVTFIDGEEAHRWELSRLYRTPAELVNELTAFMTLRAGDLLLVGLPGDAPPARPGQTLRVQAEGLPDLVTHLVQEAV